MKVKFIFLLFIFFVQIFKNGLAFTEEHERAYFEKAWMYYTQDQLEKALKIITSFNYLESEYRYDWSILLSLIYVKQKKYSKALEEIKKIREELEKAYLVIRYGTKLDISEKTSLGIKTLYSKMLYASAFANYGLGNYKSAIDDFLIMTSLEEYRGAIEEIYSFLAICYYKINEYSKSLEFFKRAYELCEDDEKKDALAYNIGAVNAILKNIDEAIRWLKISFRHNRVYWLEKIKSDKDFDSIRDSEKFNEFIKQQKQMLQK